MKTSLCAAAALGLSAVFASSTNVAAQGTAFTYQSRLNYVGSPANGLYEMSFALHDAVTNGNLVGTLLTVVPVPVSNGLFTVSLDIGANAFTGANRWLEASISVDQPVAITPNSDRTSKTDIASVDTAAILERVTKLPIQQWRFKTEAEDVKHLGPMAQDFRAAFGLGAHDTAIATVDADGVALAAIQGLNELTEELKRRDAENAEVKARLTNLETLITQLTGKGN